MLQMSSDNDPDQGLEEFLIHISLITDIDNVKNNENAVY